MSTKTLLTINEVFKLLDVEDDEFNSKYRILEVNFGSAKCDYLKYIFFTWLYSSVMKLKII